MAERWSCIAGEEYSGQVCSTPASAHTMFAQVDATSVGLALAGLLLSIGLLFLYQSRTRVLLIDFAILNPPRRNRRDRTWSMQAASSSGVFTADSLEFMEKLYQASGVGPYTYFPECALKMLEKEGPYTERELKYGIPLAGRLEEADAAAYPTITELLQKTGIKPEEIGAVITASDCFWSQPSMSARIVNHFKLRSDTLTYTMAGMGCSNGGIAVDMAKRLLMANPEMLVLVFNHENVSAGGYIGNDHSMLLPYCLFRVSGAAAFMSNRKQDLKRAKYELVYSIRTHLGFDDKGFHCIKDGVDQKGFPGIRLNKDVVPSATKALKINLIRAGPRILPIMELIKVALKKRYRPDFKKATEHFLIHTGGKGVLDSVKKGFGLTEEKMKPSRDALYRFANTAGASSWYSLCALESRNGVKEGDRILALMFGAGFKACSLMWKARRHIHEVHPVWEATNENCDEDML